MRPLFVVHVPKCAGTSFRKYLGQVYPSRVKEDYPHPWGPVDFPVPKVESDSVIIGHYQAKRYKDYRGKADFVVWVRHPVNVVISLYNYWLRSPSRFNPSCVRLHREGLSLLEFAALPEIRNLQSWFLEGFPLRNFSFIGIVEWYDLHLASFDKRFGISGFDAYKIRLNSAPFNSRVSMDDKDRILNLNRKDNELYRQAVHISVEAKW